MAENAGLKGVELINHKSERLDIDRIFEDNDVVGLYFSAHWCPPCRAFTPVLRETYNKLTEDGKKIEIIFISFDNDVSAFENYFGSMPWIAVPFTSGIKDSLSMRYEVQGIPTLIFLNKDGSLRLTNGRDVVSVYGTAGFPYTQEALSAAKPQCMPCTLI